FATPIYFNSVPAPLKVFIDRLEQLFVKKENIDEDTVYQKRGVLITTMGSDEEYVTNSIYSMFKQVFSCFSCEFMKYYFVSETDKFSDICLKEYRQ
ncbi:MAG: NAD(P)H-dependent oxidoreductase, partial [Oscillospiraceae bacterium]